MSDENLNLPSALRPDAPLLLANRSCILDLDDNSSLLLSPDSGGCNFNLSERGRHSVPCINTSSSDGAVMQPVNAQTQAKLSIQDNYCVNTSNNSSAYLWDDTFSMSSNRDSDEGMNSVAVSPNSETSVCGTPYRGSVDLSCNSGEMLVQSNSFIQEDPAVPSLPSSEVSPVVTSQAESKPLLTTFVFGDQEEDGAVLNSSLALSSEKANVVCTSLCENCSVDFAPEVRGHALFETAVCAELDQDGNTSLPNFTSKSPTSWETTNIIGLCSCGMSCQNPLNISCSSGEMVVRSDSFIMDERAPASLVSSCEDSSAPLVTSYAESELFLAHMSEREDHVEHAESNPCLGQTFTLEYNLELPSEEGACEPLLALSTKASLYSTFLCENLPADLANEAQFIQTSQAEAIHESYAPEQSVLATTFGTSVCAVRNEGNCTSTPLQVTGDSMPSLPSLAVSPCIEDTGSPALRPVLTRKNSVPKRFERGLAISGKVAKMGINKISKSDLIGMKCKQGAVSNNALVEKPSQMNNKGHKFGSSKPSPTRTVTSTASQLSKAIDNSLRRSNLVAQKNELKLQKSQNAEEVQIGCQTSVNTPASSNEEQVSSSQTKADPNKNIANATFCYPEKCQQKCGNAASKLSPKKDPADKVIKVKSVSALGHNKSASKTLDSCSNADSAIATSNSRHLKMAIPQKNSACFTLSKSKTEHLKKQGRPVSRCDSSPSGAGGAVEAVEKNGQKVKRLGLEVDSKTLAAASCSTATNIQVCAPPSQSRGRASSLKTSSASPIPTTPLNKHRQGTSGRENFKTCAVGTPLSRQKCTGSGKPSGASALAATPGARTKPAALFTRTTPRSSLMGPPLTPLPRLQQQKTSGSNRNQSMPVVHSQTSNLARPTQVSGVAGGRKTPLKVPALKTSLAAALAKNSASVLTASCKSTSAAVGLTSGHIRPKRPTGAKVPRSAPVDRSKSKAGAHPQHQCERGKSRSRETDTQDVEPAGVVEAQNQHLHARLSQSNVGFEAVVIVLQQTIAQRDEAVQQSRGLSQELLELREELMHTVNRSEGLAQEKEALKASLEDALQQVQAEHQRDLLELEQRLREQHQNEMRAAQQQIREESERSRERLQLQLEELRVAQEAMRQDLETSHSQVLQSVRQQHQLSLQELRDVHAQELQFLDRTLKDAETILNERILKLTQENAALMERLTEENKSDDQAQKDSHTVYLERELESLNAVLDMKTEQLRQQEKKLMEVDKLTEKNVTLGESLRKVQQENEDLKARMERHAALSRQLSTEQTQLQESLQKESKVNKRLSMENEELLWKLHNGDLGGPRVASPNTPSPHFSLQSPRASLFSSSPVSPR